MSFYEGLMDERQRNAKLALERMQIEDDRMKLDLTRRSMAANDAAKQAWGQFDPADPETSLMKIAGAMGKAGATDAATKTLGAAEQFGLRKQQQLNYQSEIEHRSAQEEQARINAELKSKDEDRKEKADQDRFALAERRQASTDAKMLAQLRLEGKRADIAAGHLALATKEAAKRDARADTHEKMWEDAEKEKIKKERMAQEGAKDKLKLSIEKLARPTSIQIKSAQAVLDEDERTKNAPDSVKASLANLLAARAGQSIAKKLSTDNPNWTPDDHDAAVREELDKALASGEVKTQKSGGFSLFGIDIMKPKDEVTLNIGKKDQQPPAAAEKPAAGGTAAPAPAAGAVELQRGSKPRSTDGTPGRQSASGIIIGSVRKGYRYKGGDPASPTSWEKAE